MHETVSAAKAQVRHRVRAERAARQESDRLAAAAKLTRQLISLVTDEGARSVSCYLPVGGEPDTTPFIAWAHDHGIDVLLPATRPDGLLDWLRHSGGPTVTGGYGIPEPDGEPLSPLAVSDVDLMLIPACAVDRHGMRLGWGRGYFDRNLTAMPARPPVFAVVFESEFVDTLPAEPHDVPVQGVVTPERMVRFES